MRNGYCLEYHKTVWNVLKERGRPLRPQRVHRHAGVPRLLGGRQRAELRRRERPAERHRRRPLGRDERVLDLGPRRRRLPEHATSHRSSPPRPVHPLDAVRLLLADHADAPAGRARRQPPPVPLGLRREPGETTDKQPTRSTTTASTRRSTPGCSLTSTPTPSSRARPACRSSGRWCSCTRTMRTLTASSTPTTSATSCWSRRSSSRRETARDVYLPPGDWHDFWTDERNSGGKVVAWSNPDGTKFPVFVRDGGIVPMLLEDAETLCDADYVNKPEIKTATDGLLFLVYPSASGRFHCVRWNGHPISEVGGRDDDQHRIGGPPDRSQGPSRAAPARVRVQGTDLPKRSPADFETALSAGATMREKVFSMSNCNTLAIPSEIIF